MTNEQKQLLKELKEAIKEFKEQMPLGASECKLIEERIDPMLELSNDILKLIADFDKSERSWPTTILLALGRATGMILGAMDYIHATKIPAMDLYINMMLPLCREYAEHEISIDSQNLQAEDEENVAN